ncbi:MULTISPECIES: sugar ABC transporter permease [Lactobacillaceae]|jgi:arabinogalactan oligomer/maltooligosaccharide transport system permease protein|uniref:Binding-protein-dependent transport systems inner membrane component n=5 Tax=Lacticaseibacillus TaxID=2759736 RepID=A0A8E0IHD8_LACPA|nr:MULTISPECIES: sugar ABC transporter permease [Lactobacillaceae]EKQ03806.1 permease component of an ABC superfamily maltose/maltodextrin transporter [Lacticaseibacillus casei 21/1]EPC34114.1 maltose ABC transporter, permease [Lacticaseibacillus paracasei subsp. paracasei Lpp120]EPC51790.1 Binding-protein-dependent transport systems inner membrane component [Lacticaseibacillus paracasei subsp. paracasei CNCM I-4270]EPC72272.1 Binding-protein-dependent transport systems inner membrane component
MTSYHAQRRASLIARYVLLALLAALWLFPIVWIVLASFSYNDTGFVSTIWPKQFTLSNYTGIFTSTQFPFVYWIRNTLFVSLVSMVLSTFVTISVAYALSRLRFRFRKPYLQIALVLGMFPGFMSMIALYYILKSFNMLNLGGLILVYVGGAGLGFYIAKGFFDTIPRSIDEAAEIDGASRWQVFLHIGLPMSKPIIVYTALTAFIAPWTDFIFSGIILSSSGNAKTYTIAYGLYNMVHATKGTSTTYFTWFIAGCVVIAVPITILFIIMQKFYVNGITAGADKG